MSAINPIVLPGKSFDLNSFTYNGHKLRPVLIDGKPWFPTADLGDILYGRRVGLHIRDDVFNADERLVLSRHSANLALSAECVELLFHPKTHTMQFLSESGLYKLILRAQRSNPAAREFQDWVTKEVLPRIRRDGAYIMGEEKVATGEVQIGDFFESMADAIRKKMNAAFEAQAALARALRSGWKPRHLRT